MGGHVGLLVGKSEGPLVGSAVGLAVGSIVVGLVVGSIVEASVGAYVEFICPPSTCREIKAEGPTVGADSVVGEENEDGLLGMSSVGNSFDPERFDSSDAKVVLLENSRDETTISVTAATINMAQKATHTFNKKGDSRSQRGTILLSVRLGRNVARIFTIPPSIRLTDTVGTNNSRGTGLGPSGKSFGDAGISSRKRSFGLDQNWLERLLIMLSSNSPLVSSVMVVGQLWWVWWEFGALLSLLLRSCAILYHFLASQGKPTNNKKEIGCTS